MKAIVVDSQFGYLMREFRELLADVAKWAYLDDRTLLEATLDSLDHVYADPIGSLAFIAISESV